jgi:hypothetical protein
MSSIPRRAAGRRGPAGRGSLRGSGPGADRANGSGAARPGGEAGNAASVFALYVEGPRDQSLLEAWAQRVSPALAEQVSEVTVILGGCQPARAAEHFRALRERRAEARGLCVLDRDAAGAPRPRAVEEPGLETFTWGRRHVESYVLVPDAIRRSLRLPADDARIERFFARELPAGEEALGALDAKRLFAFRGELHQLVGRPVRPVQVARAMFAGEIHRDVFELLARLRAGVGLDRARREPPEPTAR